jgi:hypothetical protein
MRSGAVEIGNTRAITAGKCSRRLGGLQGFDPIQLTPVELGLSGCGENQFGIPELRWPTRLGQARVAGYLVDLVCVVYLVDLIHLISFAQPENQTDQTNQTTVFLCWRTF